MKLEVCFLGTPTIKADGIEVQIPQKKLLALLLYLLYHVRCTREELVSVFWCDISEENARQNLRNGLFRLKKLLGEGLLSTQGSQRVDLRPDITVYRDTDALVAEDGGARLLRLTSFVFLDKLSLRDTPEFDRWTASMRAAYERIVVERLESNMRAARHAGEQDLEEYAIKLLSISPYHEDACRVLLQQYGNRGLYGDVVRLYTAFSERLNDELGIAPEKETQQLYRSVMKLRDFHLNNQDLKIAGPDHESIKEEIVSQYRRFMNGQADCHCVVKGGMGAGTSQVMAAALHSIKQGEHTLLRVKFEVMNLGIPCYAIGKILDLLSAAGAVPAAEPRYCDFETLLLYHMSRIEKVTARLKGRRQRIVLLVENLEAMDPHSMDLFLTHLLGKCGEKLMLIGAYCTNLGPDRNTLSTLELMGGISVLTLPPLDSQATISYLSHRVPRMPEPPDLRGIWQHTGGVLMLLENVVQNIRAGAPSLYDLTGETAKQLSILRSSMSAEEWHCLQVISVFRHGVELERLACVTGKNTLELISIVERLRQRELVSEEQFDSHLLARVHPEMLREAIYHGLSRLQRTELHRVAARLYEEQEERNRRDYFSLRELHDHFSQAGCGYERLYYAIRELWYRLDYCDELFPAIKNDPDLLGTLYISRAESHRVLERLEEELGRLSDALSPEQLCNLTMMSDYLKGRTLIRDSRGDEGIVYVRRLISAAQQCGRDDMLLKGYLEVIFYGLKSENEPLMREYIQHARTVATFCAFEMEGGILLRLEAWCNIKAGAYETAEQQLLQSVEVLQRPKLRGYSYINVAAAYDYLGLIYRKQQDYARSGEYLQRAIDLCIQKNVKKTLDLFYSDLGYTQFLQGEYEKAQENFLKSAEFYSMFDNCWMRSVGESCLAMISVLEGNCGRALEHYRRAEIYAKKDRTAEEMELLAQAQAKLSEASAL